MTGINSMRLAAAMALVRTGLGPEVATCAALALHPLDDSVTPSPSVERQIRRRSRAFADQLKALAAPTDASAIPVIVRAVRDYRSFALAAGESYYVRRYDEALGLLSQLVTPAASPGGEAATTISHPRQVQIASPPEPVGDDQPGNVRIRFALTQSPDRAWINRLVDLAPNVEVAGAACTASIPKAGMLEALNGLAAAIDRTNVLVAADEEIDSWWRDRPFGQDGPAEATEIGTGDKPPPISSNLTPTQQWNRNLPALAVILLLAVVMLIAIVATQASTRSTPTAPSPPVVEEVEEVEEVEAHWVNIERLETGDCFVGSIGPSIDQGTWERVLVTACDTPGTHEVAGIGANGSRKAISMDTPEGKRIVLYVPTG